MPDLPTFDALFRIGRDEVLVRNAQISRDAVEREGMDANVMVAAGGAMADECVGQISDLGSSLFLASAEKQALDSLVFDRYNMLRKPDAAGVGSVQFSTTAPSPTSFTLPSGIIIQTATGIQYITTEASIFPIGAVGPITVGVRSLLAGPNQNTKAGTLTSLVSTVSGAPTDLAVTNVFATFGADDVESDDALRDRARRFFVTARRGTLPALEEAALGVAGVRTAKAFEGLDAMGRPARIVQLIVADAFTEQFVDFTTVPPRYQTQSNAIASQVFAALSDVRAGGVYVQVVVANVIIQPVQLTLAFQAGVDVNNTALQARAAVVNVINSLSPGDSLTQAALQQALQLVPGLAFTGQEVLSPAGDVVPKPLQVIRTSLGLVSAVAAQTDQPLITGSNPDAFILAGG